MVAKHLDMSDLDSIRDFVAHTLSEFGCIDVLVNNAGVPMRGTALETTEEDWDWVSDVNQKGLFFCTQECARAMIARGEGGKIIRAYLKSRFGSCGFSLRGDGPGSCTQV